MRTIRLITLFIVLGLLLGVPAVAQSTLLLIDQDGLTMAMTSSELRDDNLHFDVIIENDTGHKLYMLINDAYADGVEVEGVGIFGIGTEGQTEDYFFFQPMDGDGMEVLRNVDELSFVIEVRDDDTLDLLFTVPVVLGSEANGFLMLPASEYEPEYEPEDESEDEPEDESEDEPEDESEDEPSYSYEDLARKYAQMQLILPDNGWGEWEYTKNNMLRMRVEVENTSSTRTVEAFEIYMYATDAWGDPIYGEDYVYYETTQTVVEPSETTMSDYVTMPDADEIDRVYAGIHRVRYTDGTIVEADPVLYNYWDIE